MILILLGTQKNNFNRLLQAVQDNIDNKIISEKVIVQAGCTKFNSKDMEIFDLIQIDEMNKLMDSANLIITHGGVGSIVGALKRRKKIIAMPRLKEYKEHINNHQEEIVSMFEQQGFIKSVNNTKELTDVLLDIENFNPKIYQSNTNNIIKLISKYIDEN